MPTVKESNMGSASRSTRNQVSLGTLHAGQVKAYWALKPYRFKALRCGRRWGKTDFAKTWIAQGLSQGYECAWFAPQHKTWSEVYPEIVNMIRPNCRRFRLQYGRDLEVLWSL